MYVLIELDRMVLLHKHPNLFVLADVAWIEAHHKAYAIFGLEDATGFRQFTDMELALLYKNMTGAETKLKRQQLLQVVFDAATRTSVSDIDAVEAEQQAEQVQDDEQVWIYVRGAKRPAQKPDLFEQACRRANRSEEEERKAIAGELPALTRKVEPLSQRTGDDRPAPATQHRAKPATGVKRGTAKAIIWATADKIWEDAGKPTDKADVLVIRKLVMDKLEKDEGIKRASASSELGAWHKDRAPF